MVLHVTHMQKFARLVREIDSLDETHRPKHVELRDRFQRLVLTEVIAAQTLGGTRSRRSPRDHQGICALAVQRVADWFRIQGAATPEQIADYYVDLALRLVLDRERVRDRA